MPVFSHHNHRAVTDLPLLTRLSAVTWKSYSIRISSQQWHDMLAKLRYYIVGLKADLHYCQMNAKRLFLYLKTIQNIILAECRSKAIIIKWVLHYESNTTIAIWTRKLEVKIISKTYTYLFSWRTWPEYVNAILSIIIIRKNTRKSQEAMLEKSNVWLLPFLKNLI